MKFLFINILSIFIDFILIAGSELSMNNRNFDKRIKPILSLWRKLNEVCNMGILKFSMTFICIVI